MQIRVRGRTKRVPDLVMHRARVRNYAAAGKQGSDPPRRGKPLPGQGKMQLNPLLDNIKLVPTYQGNWPAPADRPPNSRMEEYIYVGRNHLLRP